MIPIVPGPWLLSHKATTSNLAKEHRVKVNECLQVNATSVPFSGVGLLAPKGGLLRESTQGPVSPGGSTSAQSSFRGYGWRREREIFI